MTSKKMLLRMIVASSEEPQESPLTDSCPCDACARAPRCAALKLACSAYAAFHGSRPWELLPRVDASHQLYTRLLGP
jgi:hypothetical protein